MVHPEWRNPNSDHWTTYRVTTELIEPGKPGNPEREYIITGKSSRDACKAIHLSDLKYMGLKPTYFMHYHKELEGEDYLLIRVKRAAKASEISGKPEVVLEI